MNVGDKGYSWLRRSQDVGAQAIASTGIAADVADEKTDFFDHARIAARYSALQVWMRDSRKTE